MFQRRIPEWLRHAPTPNIKGFAALAGIEAVARGTLISVFPLVMYRVFRDAVVVSQIYFFVGIASMAVALLVPWLTRFIGRRWIYSAGSALFVASAFLALQGSPTAMVLALLCNAVAVVTVFVCFNAYVLDFVSRFELGTCETMRLFYSALAWTAGPAGGVWMLQYWPPAPFLLSAAAAVSMLCVFWWMRLGNGKMISRARAPTPNPIAYLWRFFEQPRLVAGWLFAVIRSCGWWVYVVYLPIFAVKNGLGENVGGIALSVSNSLLFTTPLMLRWMRLHSLRNTLRTGFFISAAIFTVASLGDNYPWATVLLLFSGTVFLILLDISAGLPFLMAVKPSERSEMSAVYATFRDVSGILSPGVAWVVLLVAPVSGVFAAAGIGLFVAWSIAGGLHPRLGAPRPQRPPSPVADGARTPEHVP